MERQERCMIGPTKPGWETSVRHVGNVRACDKSHLLAR
jgi:hypothetical protein